MAFDCNPSIHPKLITHPKKMLILFLLPLLLAPAFAAQCNANDVAIYRERGEQFPTLLRPLGGLFVSEEEFKNAVVHAIGLSEPCASCFSSTYICTWDSCKRSCIFDGPACTECRRTQGCTASLVDCTGFVGVR
jgi:hypothetical protein